MKPLRHIEKVVAAISVPENIRTARTRQIISLSHNEEPMTVILHQGTMALYRNDDNLLIRHVKGLMIFGLNYFSGVTEDVYLKAREPSTYEIIPTRNFFAIVERDNLWKDISYILMFSAKCVVQTYKKSAGLTTYELIRENLLELMSEEESVRLNVSACDYIQEKTNLSRSRIMAILRELKIGGYIELSKGVLNKLSKLPSKF